MGVWDEGLGKHEVDREQAINKESREGKCFFWRYQPNMLFKAAKELQKRDQEARELKRSLLYTQIGLGIAAFALFVDVLLRWWGK